MATIRKKGDKYQVQIRRKGFAPVSRSFHQRVDAEQWARHMDVKADRGELPSPIKVLDKHTIKSILERYKREISIKKKSHVTEQHVLNRLMRQSFATLTLAEVTAARLCPYRDERLKQVKPGTVRREMAILRHAFDVAEREWGIPIRENPLSKLPKIRPQAGRTRRLYHEEYTTIKQAAVTTRNLHLIPMMDFALATAMRRGEILRLKWSDIDLKDRTLHIPLSKNGHARTIPLSSQALEILAGLREGGCEPDDLVFPTTDNAVKLAWQRLISRSGVIDLHFHDLRHEAISRFFEQGLSVPEVALISGHRDFKMLFRYTHLKAQDIATKLNPSPKKEYASDASVHWCNDCRYSDCG